MAIDTAAKRASVQAYTLGLMRLPPTGSVTKADQATVAWLYSGHSYFPLIALYRFHKWFFVSAQAFGI